MNTYEYDLNQTARAAYHAYGSVTDFKNYQGNPMPKFEDLPQRIQEAWVAAVGGALEDYHDQTRKQAQ